MMLVCDVCNNGYALYPEHEKVASHYGVRAGSGPNDVLKFQICYDCAVRISDIREKCLNGPKSIGEAS